MYLNCISSHYYLLPFIFLSFIFGRISPPYRTHEKGMELNLVRGVWQMNGGLYVYQIYCDISDVKSQ